MYQQAGTRWSQLQTGVYKLDWMIDITIVVTSQVEVTPHNSSWLLFSHDKNRVEYALPCQKTLIFQNIFQDCCGKS